MGARKGAARVGACLVSLEKQSICGTLFSLLWGGGGGAFLYREPFFFFFGFSHYVQNFFGAHAHTVARVIANMLLW